MWPRALRWKGWGLEALWNWLDCGWFYNPAFPQTESCSNKCVCFVKVFETSSSTLGTVGLRTRYCWGEVNEEQLDHGTSFIKVEIQTHLVSFISFPLLPPGFGSRPNGPPEGEEVCESHLQLWSRYSTPLLSTQAIFLYPKMFRFWLQNTVLYITLFSIYISNTTVQEHN